MIPDIYRTGGLLVSRLHALGRSLLAAPGQCISIPDGPFEESDSESQSQIWNVVSRVMSYRCMARALGYRASIQEGRLKWVSVVPGLREGGEGIRDMHV